MAFAGLLLVVLGIGGLLAHHVVTVGPEQVGFVAGMSWAAIGIGVLVMVGAVARGAGRGAYPLAIGAGALIAQKTSHWMNNGHVQAVQPWANIGLLLLIAGGAFFVLLEMGDDSFELAFTFGLFAATSLGTDIAFDFGNGWDGLMNVGTAVFTSGMVIAVVGGLIEDRSASDDVADTLAFTAVAGLGLAAVAITIMNSFRVVTGLEVWLLVPLAVLGFWAAAPRIGFAVLDAAPRFSYTDGEQDQDRVVMLGWGFVLLAISRFCCRWRSSFSGRHWCSPLCCSCSRRARGRRRCASGPLVIRKPCGC